VPKHIGTHPKKFMKCLIKQVLTFQVTQPGSRTEPNRSFINRFLSYFGQTRTEPLFWNFWKPNRSWTECVKKYRTL